MPFVYLVEAHIKPGPLGLLLFLLLIWLLAKFQLPRSFTNDPN